MNTFIKYIYLYLIAYVYTYAGQFLLAGTNQAR